jgi:hypothetical protein
MTWREILLGADGSVRDTKVIDSRSKLRVRVATLTMHARKRSIYQTKKAFSKRAARQQTERTPLHYLQ